MDYKTIIVERKAEVGILYLNRPEVLNALSNEMREELMDFMGKAAADDGLAGSDPHWKGKGLLRRALI